MEALKQVPPHGGKFNKILHWSKLVVFTGSVQFFIQGIGLISGIIIIRLLTTHEYALYTLANTILSTMTLLADGGISNGVMASGAKVWDDKEKLGVVLSTGLMMRRKFAIYSMLVSLPVLFYLLYHHGAGWLFTVLILISIVPAFNANLSDNLLEIAPKLHQDIPRLQKNQLAAGIGRFVLIAVSIFIFPWSFIAIIANGIPRTIANFRLKKISAEYADLTQKPDPAIEKQIFSIVKRMLPGIIYFCLSGQITIFIISIFGNTKGIAEAGALSRLGLMLNVFGIIGTTLVTPRFARIASNSRLLVVRYVQIQLILFLFSALIIGLVYVFPNQTLWILGKGYAHLKVELVLNIAVACIGLFVRMGFSLSIARGWVVNPFICIPCNLLSIIVGVLFINITTLKGVLTLNFFVGFVDFLMYAIFTLNKIRLLRQSQIKNLLITQ